MIDRIEINPKSHSGKPFISGTKVAVKDVLNLLAEGLSFNKITQKRYPNLKQEDIKACLAYAIELIEKTSSVQPQTLTATEVRRLPKSKRRQILRQAVEAATIDYEIIDHS